MDKKTSQVMIKMTPEIKRAADLLKIKYGCSGINTLFERLVEDTIDKEPTVKAMLEQIDK